MNKLLALALTRIGCGYVWGSQGQVLTTTILAALKARFGSEHYVFKNASGTVDAAKWIGKQVFDCSGLVVWLLQQLGFLTTAQDFTANSIYYGLCTKITKSQLQPGDLVFIDRGANGSIEHIGIYAGDNTVVHARTTSAGVVHTELYSDFNLFGRLKFAIGDDGAGAEKPIGTGRITAKPFLNVRMGPGKEYTDIGDLYNNAVVPVYEARNGWYRIGPSKWISGDYTRFTMTHDTIIADLVDEMVDDELIAAQDKQTWLDILNGKKDPAPEILRVVFRNAVDLI